jgi:hypothetical protein
MAQRDILPLEIIHANGARYNPAANIPSALEFDGEFALTNPLGHLYPDHEQAGDLELIGSDNAQPGGCARVRIIASGDAITVPASWVNVGTDEIDTTAGAENILFVLQVSDTEVNYACKVV